MISVPKAASKKGKLAVKKGNVFVLNTMIVLIVVSALGLIFGA